MQKLLLVSLATALIACTFPLTLSSANAETTLAMAPQPEPKKKCITIGDKRICLEDFGGKKDDDEDEPKKTGNICEGEIACPPGYVVLDKPNKYGACCEPKEGFPDTTPAPAPGPAGGGDTTKENICEGEIACPPGYVVLDKPNKYGACCEPKEGFPTTTPAPAPTDAVPEDASSPEPTNADYGKCKIPEQKSFVGRGCLKGHDSTALPEYKAAEYTTTCKGKSGIPLCGPVPSRGGQFECWCYF
jgi:hypothetical protein